MAFPPEVNTAAASLLKSHAVFRVFIIFAHVCKNYEKLHNIMRKFSFVVHTLFSFFLNKAFKTPYNLFR